MASNRIAFIGIDPISASIAFALQEREPSLELIGYDANQAVADLAKVRGAFDKVRRKPGATCEGAGLIIIAQPLADIENTFAEIAPHLEEGSIVTDTAHLKRPVLRWAEDILPDYVSYLGGHIVPNPAVVGLKALEGLDDASPKLLKEALYCLTMSPSTPTDAVDVCLWLAQVIEANPFFIDVKEHDGLLAGVEGLPDLLTVALLRSTVDSPGWKEMRKFAGRRFAAATETVDDVSGRHPSLFLNRENVIHRLDALIGELVYLRDMLVKDDEEALSQVVDEAADGRARWMMERGKGMWADESAFDADGVPGAGEQLKTALFGNLISRFGREPGKPEEE